jgi:hypothetical protein
MSHLTMQVIHLWKSNLDFLSNLIEFFKKMTVKYENEVQNKFKK